MALDVRVHVALQFPSHQYQIVALQETTSFAKGKQPHFVQHQVQPATYGAMALQLIV